MRKNKQQTHLIMVGEVVVRDGNGSWTHDSINKAISTIRKWIVINPYMAWAKNRDSITVSHCPPSIVTWRAPHHSIASGLAVMNVETMNDYICNKLNSDARTISNVDIGPTAINGLEAVHYKFLFQLYHHVPFEYNP